jgi:hypothetical protein
MVCISDLVPGGSTIQELLHPGGPSHSATLRLPPTINADGIGGITGAVYNLIRIAALEAQAV